MEKAAIILSEISILPIKPKDGLIGFASFVLNNHFYVGNVAVYSRLGGSIRLVFPEKTLPNGKKIHCFHPITKEAGSFIVSRVGEALLKLSGGNVHG